MSGFDLERFEGEGGFVPQRTPKPVKVKSNKNYVALVGMDHDGHRYEAGAKVSDLPEDAVKWLLRRGYIKEESE